jgi:hypothetical protein
MGVRVIGKSAFLERHTAVFKKMSGKRVEAGWFDVRYPSGANAGKLVADVMRINEYGAVINHGTTVTVIPARPVRRLANEEFKRKRKAIESKIMDDLLAGKIKPKQYLEEVGKALAHIIEDSMIYGGWTPNAPSTIRKKGSDVPLVDTEFALNNVTSKVF